MTVTVNAICRIARKHTLAGDQLTAVSKVSKWKVISCIQSPKRFAEFAEGSFHLTANEVSVHEQEIA
ncbi:hypothetical protein GDO86_004307 [Hymenochirus boettgeri]|uniref:Uncharacterized protein n=1 Tax=Hymenochirus boettgeri TaxID=247094 RepID=A0A8T2K7C1_9PIPI|nr:hypothetical protein GDO86_004307 [Hymenochirus boettgeri]